MRSTLSTPGITKRRKIIKMHQLRNILLLTAIILYVDISGVKFYGEAAVKRSGCNQNILIPHGFATFVENDSVILFECFNGYLPYGDMKATCKGDKWDTQPPKCLKKGCQQLKIPIHGNILEEFSGALATFNCDSGYELIGEPVLTCDGTDWSGSPPICNKLPRQVLSNPVNKTDL
ncbi:unnamed protein product [Allacma fusca]|uniref:Sushi domain-containing protein n=1 Tax=Allacma fusca TaxID=39272 RepID=A0A8J2JN61_9HEXA|nr:unnamed protein product [Allacma fusca]